MFKSDKIENAGSLNIFKRLIFCLIFILLGSITYAQQINENEWAIIYGPIPRRQAGYATDIIDIKLNISYMAFLATNRLIRGKMLVIRPLLSDDIPENPFDNTKYSPEIFSGLRVGNTNDASTFQASRITLEILSRYETLVPVGMVIFQREFSVQGDTIFMGTLMTGNFHNWDKRALMEFLDG